jgi:hypothetical protein
LRIGFRRYLKTVTAEHFAIDETRVAEDARYDGLYGVEGPSARKRTLAYWTVSMRRGPQGRQFGSVERLRRSGSAL